MMLKSLPLVALALIPNLAVADDKRSSPSFDRTSFPAIQWPAKTADQSRWSLGGSVQPEMKSTWSRWGIACEGANLISGKECHRGTVETRGIMEKGWISLEPPEKDRDWDRWMVVCGAVDPVQGKECIVGEDGRAKIVDRAPPPGMVVFGEQQYLPDRDWDRWMVVCGAVDPVQGKECIVGEDGRAKIVDRAALPTDEAHSARNNHDTEYSSREVSLWDDVRNTQGELFKEWERRVVARNEAAAAAEEARRVRDALVLRQSADALRIAVVYLFERYSRISRIKDISDAARLVFPPTALMDSLSEMSNRHDMERKPHVEEIKKRDAEVSAAQKSVDDAKSRVEWEVERTRDLPYEMREHRYERQNQDGSFQLPAEGPANEDLSQRTG